MNKGRHTLEGVAYVAVDQVWPALQDCSCVGGEEGSRCRLAM